MKANSVFSNLIWRLFERIGAQSVTLVVSIVLARLLDPDAYGVLALMTVFTSIMQVFVDSGLGNALIQKKSADDLDFSSVFFFNLFFSVVLYVLLFVLAPAISVFYKMPELKNMFRVLSLMLIISGVKNVQLAYVSRNMMFKRFFFSTLGGTIAAAAAGIWMAWRGWGVWALIFQNLLNQTIDTLILWITVKWRPKLMFSFRRLRQLFSYGWKLLVSALLDTGYRDLRNLLIGKLYSAEDLAFYTRGQQLPNLIVSNINASIDSVLLPAMAREQDEGKRVKEMTRRAIQISTYIMSPMMIGLAVCAEPLIRIVLTDKWLPCIPYLRIFCVTYIFYPIHTANLNAIKAMGRSDYFLKLEIIKKIIGLSVLIAVMRYGVLAIAISLLFTNVSSQLINSWPNRKLLNYPYLEQLRDILPGIMLAVAMGGAIYFIRFLGLNTWGTLILQVLSGVIIYPLVSWH